MNIRYTWVVMVTRAHMWERGRRINEKTGRSSTTYIILLGGLIPIHSRPITYTLQTNIPLCLNASSHQASVQRTVLSSFSQNTSAYVRLCCPLILLGTSCRKGSGMYTRAKHINTRKYRIRELSETGEVKIYEVAGETRISQQTYLQSHFLVQRLRNIAAHSWENVPMLRGISY